jgi:hypothetical protein
VSKRLSSYLGASNELRQLSRRAERLLALQRLYERMAPPSLMRASRVISLEQQTLVLAADNGAVAAKLRQLAPQLAGQLQNAECEVTRILVRVQVSQPPRPAAKAAGLSAAGKSKLIELAGELRDSPLKNALCRLGRRS